jgi:hypothetical protein
MKKKAYYIACSLLFIFCDQLTTKKISNKSIPTKFQFKSCSIQTPSLGDPLQHHNQSSAAQDSYTAILRARFAPLLLSWALGTASKLSMYLPLR